MHVRCNHLLRIMAQIRCFLALSIILGLSGITKCDSEMLNDAGTATKENNTCNANTPKHFDDCYYPHRCNKRNYCGEPLYCDYAVYFGQREDGDERVLNKHYRKPSDVGQKRFVVEVKYQRKKSLDKNFSITYIRVEDKDKSRQIYDDKVSIVAGGIGEKYVDIKIVTDYSKPCKYKVTAFGKYKN